MADNQLWVYRTGRRRVTGLRRKDLRRLLSSGVLNADTLVGQEDQHYLQPLGKSPAADEIVNAVEDLARRFAVLPMAIYLLIFPIILGVTVFILDGYVDSDAHWGFWTAFTLGKLGVCWRLFRIWRYHLGVTHWTQSAWRSFPFALPMTSMIWCWISLYPLVKNYTVSNEIYRYSNRWMKILCWAVCFFSYGIGLFNFIPGSVVSRQWWLLLFIFYLGAFSLLLTCIERRQAVESRHCLIKLARGALHNQAVIDYQAILTAENKLIRRGRVAAGWFLSLTFIIGWLIGGWALFKTLDNNRWLRIADEWNVRNIAKSFLARNENDDLSTFGRAVESYVDNEDLPGVMLQQYTVLDGASAECRQQLSEMDQRSQAWFEMINYALERKFPPWSATWFFQGITDALIFQIYDQMLQDNCEAVWKKWMHLQWLSDLTLNNYESAVSNYPIYHGILQMDVITKILNNSQLEREDLRLYLAYSLGHEIVLRQTALAGVYNYLDMKKRDLFHYLVTPQAEDMLDYLMHDLYEVIDELPFSDPFYTMDWQDVSLPQQKIKFLLLYNLAVLSTRAQSTMLALRLYALDHQGELPEDLNKLVPEYLPKLPIDPLSGKVLEYQRGNFDVRCAYWENADHARYSVRKYYAAKLQSRHPLWLYIKPQFKSSWRGGVTVLAKPVLRNQSTLSSTSAVRQGK